MLADSHSSARIAVLIDADNTSPKYAEALLDEIARDGNPTIRRVYGDWSSAHLAGWTRRLNPLGLQAMHQHALTTRKNSTDTAMIIDAMDLLYADNVEGFAIVSSDCDFAGLAMRLRAGGKFVHGMGEAKTPAGFANACDKFVHLETLAHDHDEDHDKDHGQNHGLDRGGVTLEADEPELAEDELAVLPVINLQSALTKAVNAQSDDDGWADLGALSQHVRRTHPSFNPRTFGYKNLSSLVKDQPYLVTTGEGTGTMIQLKGKRPAKKPAQAASAVKKTAKSATTVENNAPVTDEPPPPAAPVVTRTTRTRSTGKTAPEA